MRLSVGEREQGYRAAPQPPIWAIPILRRIGAGFLTITFGDGKSVAGYENGEPVYIEESRRGTVTRRPMDAADAAGWAREGWLIPIAGETLIEDGPPQRYRARTPSDPPLPKLYQNGKAVR